jgi:salicylate hydroxylase
MVRTEYQKVLYDRAVELGVTVRLGCKIQEIDESVPSAKLDNGEVVKGDLIVGADGKRAKFVIRLEIVNVIYRCKF